MYRNQTITNKLIHIFFIFFFQEEKYPISFFLFLPHPFSVFLDVQFGHLRRHFTSLQCTSPFLGSETHRLKSSIALTCQP